MPSKMTVMHPGDGATVVPGTTWSPIPERPLPRRQGGPLLPQPYALWSPADIDEENIVYCALFDYLDRNGSYRAHTIRKMLDALDAAQKRRQPVTET